MAANGKTQMIKLGIGTVTVLGIVGVTGWLWQAEQVSAAGQPEGTAVRQRDDDDDARLNQQSTDQSQSSSTVPFQGTERTRRREGGQFSQNGGNSLFAQPGTGSSGSTFSGRTRSKHS
jgi:hypothetical protein